MYRTVVYQGKDVLGEVEVYPQRQGEEEKKKFEEIRIDYLSESSERCPPLAVLHTIASSGICFKMESKSSPQPEDNNSSSPSLLHDLHTICIRDNKVF